MPTTPRTNSNDFSSFSTSQKYSASQQFNPPRYDSVKKLSKLFDKPKHFMLVHTFIFGRKRKFIVAPPLLGVTSLIILLCTFALISLATKGFKVVYNKYSAISI